MKKIYLLFNPEESQDIKYLLRGNNNFKFKYLNFNYSDKNANFNKLFRNLHNDIISFSPDIILSAQYFFYSILKYYKNINYSDFLNSAIKLITEINAMGIDSVIICRDDPMRIYQKHKTFDIIHKITINFKTVALHTLQKINYYKSNGINNIYWFPNFTNIKKYYLDKTNKPLYDLSFIGQINKQREVFVKSIIKSFPKLNIFIGKTGSLNETRSIYSNSRINLCYGSLSDMSNKSSWGVSNRLFNIAACQGFALHDTRKDLGKLFKINNEVVTFKNVTDCINKIKYYLNNPNIRNNIARNAYKRIIKDHTNDIRYENLLKSIQ